MRTRRGESENGDGKDKGSDNDSDSVSESSSSFVKSYGLQFSVLLFCVAGAVMQIAVQLFYIDRICRISDRWKANVCANLTSGNHNREEMDVEISASEYTIFVNLIENGIPVLTSFFLGSWCDKRGSKKIFVICLSGYFISSIMYIVFSLFPDVSPRYVLTSSIPVALTGGLTALILSGCSYITRESPVEKRSFQLATFSISFDAGATIGFYLGEAVFQRYGFTQVFATSCVVFGLAVLSALVLVSERKQEVSLVMSESSRGCGATCQDFFDVGAVKDTVLTSFRSRQGGRRWWVIAFILCIVVQYFAYCARSSVFYLYTRNSFGWGFKEYSNFSGGTSVMNLVGGLLMSLVAIKLLQIPDAYLGLISVLSNLAGYLVLIFARLGWLMYLSSAVQMFGALTTATIRSLLSKCAPTEEHGKLFSFVTCLEFGMQFVSTSLYGLIYMNSVTTFPGAVFLVPISIQLGLALFFIYMICARVDLSSSSYSALLEDVRRGGINDGDEQENARLLTSRHSRYFVTD